MVRSEKTRQLIIEKTAHIFNKKGYVGTYLSDLTNATGLTKGSIYGNFKDKNEVAVEAFRYNYNFQAQELLQNMEAEKRADKKLLIFLSFYKKEYKRIFNNGGCAILNTAVDADYANPHLKKEVNKKIVDWHVSIAKIYKEGIDKGELKDIDVHKYTYKVIALIEGSIMLSKTLDKPEILISNIELLENEILELSQI